MTATLDERAALVVVAGAGKEGELAQLADPPDLAQRAVADDGQVGGRGEPTAEGVRNALPPSPRPAPPSSRPLRRGRAARRWRPGGSPAPSRESSRRRAVESVPRTTVIAEMSVAEWYSTSPPPLNSRNTSAGADGVSAVLRTVSARLRPYDGRAPAALDLDLKGGDLAEGDGVLLDRLAGRMRPPKREVQRDHDVLRRGRRPAGLAILRGAAVPDPHPVTGTETRAGGRTSRGGGAAAVPVSSPAARISAVVADPGAPRSKSEPLARGGRGVDRATTYTRLPPLVKKPSTACGR